MINKKKSFTLLEIIIVLLIMGFIYTVGISSFSKQTIEEKGYHFDFKSFLQKNLKVYDKKIELIVLDNFSIIRINNDKKSDTRFSLPKDLKFFSYWSNEKLREYFEPYFDEGYFKDVTFRYIINPNQTSTKCIILKDEKYHIQSNYFKDESIFDEIYDARDYLLNSNMKNSIVVSND